MNKIMVRAIGVLVFAAAWVFADGSTAFLHSTAQVKTYEGIPYMSGGLGPDEGKSARAMSDTDNLQLTFALQNGNYLGGAHVLIQDDKGKQILEAISDGPLFFTKLPAGNYTVTATALGKTVKRAAHLSSKGQVQLLFTWKIDDEAIATG
jgi:hypothetical protein